MLGIVHFGLDQGRRCVDVDFRSDFVSGFTEHTLSLLGSLVSPGHTVATRTSHTYCLTELIALSLKAGLFFFCLGPLRCLKILSCLSVLSFSSFSSISTHISISFSTSPSLHSFIHSFIQVTLPPDYSCLHDSSPTTDSCPRAWHICK